jgi:Flp pilus assembly protein TadD
VSRPLVFVSCGGTTAPLLPSLARHFTAVVPDARTAEQLTAQGVEALAWTALADRERLTRVPTEAARLADDWTAALAADPAGLAFRGTPRADAVLPALDAVFRRALAAQLAVVEFGRSLARSGRLAAAVVHEDVTAPVRAFLDAVRCAGVPTVHVPHGLYAEERVVGADVHGAVHTDAVAVAGPVARAWFLRRGVPPESLVVTGNPAWDALVGRPRGSAATLGLPPGHVITLATTWLGEDSAHHDGVARVQARRLGAGLAAVAAAQTAARAVAPVHLVVKLHPSAPAGEEAHVARVAAEVGARPALVVRDRLAEVLGASDVLLTQPSTIAVEAMILGTPVVAIELGYAGDAVATVPAEREAIRAALARALDGLAASAEFAARRRAFLALYNGPSDGSAAERVTALVRQLVAQARRARGATVGAARMAAARGLLHAGHAAGVLAQLDGAAGADAETLRAEALARLGRAAEAEDAYRRAVGAGAGAGAMAGLGLLLLERGARREAERLLLQAAALDGASDWAWCGLGVLAALRGDGAGAVRLLERALDLNPANPDARQALAALRGEGAARGTDAT